MKSTLIMHAYRMILSSPFQENIKSATCKTCESVM